MYFVTRLKKSSHPLKANCCPSTSLLRYATMCGERTEGLDNVMVLHNQRSSINSYETLRYFVKRDTIFHNDLNFKDMAIACRKMMQELQISAYGISTQKKRNFRNVAFLLEKTVHTNNVPFCILLAHLIHVKTGKTHQ